MEQLDKKLDVWDMLIWKTIATESKAGLQPSYVIRDMDSRCLSNNRPAHNIIAQVYTQGTLIKDPRIEDPRHKPHKPKAQAFQRLKNIETFEKT